METGSATRVYKSSSCVGGTARGGVFLHLYSTVLTVSERQQEAEGGFKIFYQRTNIRNCFNFPEFIF